MFTVSNIGEFGLIDALRRLVGKTSGGVMGIGDDAAVVPVNAKESLLITTDMLIEGVHFRRNDSMFLIGLKAMNVNISDIAAMGGMPRYAVVSLGIPGKFPISKVRQVYQGLMRAGKKFNVQIVGGDTVKNTKMVISVALIGRADSNDVVYRRGAKPGDHIFTTGPLGNSLKSGRHYRFTPRVKEASYLVKAFKPTSMIDISDGLIADLNHICKESCVGAVLDTKNIPLRRAASVNGALKDGEDFELLFTLPAPKAAALCRRPLKDMRFYYLGRIAKTKGIYLIDKMGKKKPVVVKGYTHF